MRHSLLRLLPAIASLLAGCEKEIDLNYRDITPILVIEGSLTQEGATVNLTETSPMDEPFNRSQVKGAAVWITDLTDGTQIPLHPAENDPDGPYRASVGGTIGHDYRLTVIRPDCDQANTADCPMLPATEAPKLDFAWIKMPYDRVAVLQARFSDNPALAGDCYWIRVYRNGEAYMWRAVNDNACSKGEFNEVFMTTRQDISEEEDDMVLVDGDVLTVTVCPITRAMHDYLEAIGADSTGPRLFSGPTSLGYFLAAPVSAATITFHPSEIPDF